jgi:uncharacterized protein
VHRLLRRFATIVLLSTAFASTAIAEGKPHRIAIHVDRNDPVVMNMALNNATNVIEYYRARNEDVEIDVVAYGPGLHMLRASPVQDRIKHPKEIASPGKILFSACNDTKQGMEKAEGDAISIVPDASIVPSGGDPADGIAGARLELCPALTC